MTKNPAKLAALALIVATATWPAVGAAQSISAEKTNKASEASAQTTATQNTGAQASLETQRDLAAWRPNQARPQLESQKAASSSAVSLRTAWGILQAEEGAPTKALETLTAAANLDSAAAAPAFEKGEVLYQLDRMGDAQAAWKSARDKAQAEVKARPDDARALYYLGAASVRVKDFGAARDALNKALAKGADPVLVHYQLGLSWAFAGKWQEAVDELSRTVEIDSGFAHAYYYRGLCNDKLGRKDKMLNDFNRFVTLAPTAPEAARVKSILAAVG